MGQLSETNVIAPSLVAIILLNGGTKTDFFIVWVFVCIVLIGLGQVRTNSWPDMVNWAKEKWARDWPTVPAVIDLVTTTTWQEETPLAGGGVPSGPYYVHKALLTYSYSNPEPQSGDFSRSLGTEDEAKEWADSCKGLKVMVRVDPRDPTRSVLRPEDIDAALAQTPSSG
jgi:hypothetical protein